MEGVPGKRPAILLVVVLILITTTIRTKAADEGQRKPAASAASTDLAALVNAVRARARALESSTGMHLSFQSFTSAYKLPSGSIKYSDYVVARLLYEATRDAGFWNLHWTITNREPNSDNVWRQWKGVRSVAFSAPTASAECDELSALYAFLVGRAGVRGVGLFWPYPNHTVAVWELHPTSRPAIRVVIPTSRIFLGVTDSFGTRKFNPWHQKSIHEYTRRDVPDSFQVPKELFDFFLRQMDKYGGASDSTLQQLRYLREGVFLKYWTTEEAAQDALRRRENLKTGPAEDLAAFQNFAQDMRSGPTSHCVQACPTPIECSSPTTRCSSRMVLASVCYAERACHPAMHSGCMTGRPGSRRWTTTA